MQVGYSRSMGMTSAGLYLSIVRDRRGLSRKQLAERLGVSVQTIANLENGKKETAWTSVAAFVRIVGANIDHVLMLTNDRNNDETLARQLAEAQLTPRFVSRIEEEVNHSIKNDYTDA